MNVRSPAADPHRALMARVATGDQGAFADLYDLLAPMVWGLVRSVVEDPILAEEVMRDALVRVWRQAPVFEPRNGPVMLWVGTIVRRRAVDLAGPLPA